MVKCALQCAKKRHIFLPETFCDAKICQKCVCGRGFTSDLAEGAFNAPVRGPCQNIAITFGRPMEKLEWCGNPTVEKV